MKCATFSQCWRDASAACQGICHEFRFNTRKKISVRGEHGRRIFFINTTPELPCSLYTVDEGLIRGAEQKCDKLLMIHETGRTHGIFIELKGKDIDHAADQLEGSIEKLRRDMPGVVIHGRIVSTSVPKMHRNFDNIKRHYLKQRINLECVRSDCTEKIEDIIQ